MRRLKMTMSGRSRLQRTKWRTTQNLLDGTRAIGEEGRSTTSEPGYGHPEPPLCFEGSPRTILSSPILLLAQHMRSRSSPVITSRATSLLHSFPSLRISTRHCHHTPWFLVIHPVFGTPAHIPYSGPPFIRLVGTHPDDIPPRTLICSPSSQSLSLVRNRCVTTISYGESCFRYVPINLSVVTIPFLPSRLLSFLANQTKRLRIHPH